MKHSPIVARFGAIIALLLLILYTFTTMLLLNEFLHWFPSISVNDGTISVHTTIGGLISALVISQLAITEPGTNPANRLMTADMSQHTRTIVTTIAFVYLGVWVVVGVISLLFGVMLFEEANQTLSDSGTVWLGTAIAAGYAFFGIQPTTSAT